MSLQIKHLVFTHAARKMKIEFVYFLTDTFLTGAQPEIFQDRGGFVKLGHFGKHFIKKSRKKAPQGKILEFFLLDTLKTTF